MERRSADTRTKVLEVAEEQFARDGFAGAHLQGIAERVGVQKTALYYYFASKGALYEAVLVRMLEAFDRAVTEAIDSGGAPEERLPRLVDTINDLLAEHRTYSQILIRIFVDRVEIPGDALAPVIERLVGRLFHFHHEGVESGAFVKQSSRHFFQTLLGATVFHYATGWFGARVLGVDDVFTQSAVSWRREEVRSFFLRATLRLPSESQAALGGDSD